MAFCLDLIGAQIVAKLWAVADNPSMIRERGCKVQVLAHKENAQRTLFTRDSKAVAMKVGIRLGAHLPICCIVNVQDIRWFPFIMIQHPPMTKNVQQNRVKMG